MSALVVNGTPLTITLPADAANKAGNGLCRFKAYAAGRGITAIKKDQPGFDRAKVKALRSDFEVIVAQHRQQIRPYGGLIVSDPNWEMRSFKPSAQGTSVTMRYHRVGVTDAAAATIKSLQAELAEMKAKLAARDV
jgi:hypothetical protein